MSRPRGFEWAGLEDEGRWVQWLATTIAVLAIVVVVLRIFVWGMPEARPSDGRCDPGEQIVYRDGGAWCIPEGGR